MSKRGTADMLALQAARLLEDPLLKETLAQMRQDLVTGIERVNGQHADDTERELCRQLRSLDAFKRGLYKRIRSQKIRETADKALKRDG